MGFDTIKEFFEKVVKNDQLSHAYIFSGQEMTGKRTFALELANQINQTHGDSIHPDFFVVDSTSSESGESIPIEKIREAKNFLSLSAYRGPYKFVIIDDADKMTVEAQNAFLKILEEPSESAIIILVTAYPEVLLPTISSRCQEIKFPNHSQKEVKKSLLIENVSEEKAEFLSEFVNGRMGLALQIARENLYTKVREYISEFTEIKKAPLNARLKLAQKLTEMEDTKEIKEKLLYWMLYLHMNAVRNPAGDTPKALQLMINLNYYLSQPQFNRRLMLENFMVKL